MHKHRSRYRRFSNYVSTRHQRSAQVSDDDTSSNLNCDSDSEFDQGFDKCNTHTSWQIAGGGFSPRLGAVDHDSDNVSLSSRLTSDSYRNVDSGYYSLSETVTDMPTGGDPGRGTPRASHSGRTNREQEGVLSELSRQADEAR